MGHVILERMRARIPERELTVDPDAMGAYVSDQARFCPTGRPLALVRARSLETIQTVLREASAAKVPVVPRGAGTGLVGGANASDGAIMLCLEQMTQILELDPDGRMARVEAGVLNGQLDRAAREHGLRYAPDPASRDISTIGGNIATNAGGACCLAHGVTRDHVLSLRAVLADGSVIEPGRGTRKDVAGLDLTRLLIGSEGTLAVVVEATVRLIPAPVAHGTLVALFPTLDSAGRAIVELARSERMSALEVMDRVTLTAVEEMTRMELDTSAAAMVLAQAETSDVAEVMAWGESVAGRCGASLCMSTLDPAEGELLMQARRAALPALERLGQWLLDDVAVPVPQIPELLALCEAAGKKHGLTVGTFGHAGDGNLHPTIIFDGQDRGQREAAKAVFDEILGGALELGGTIAGEHGVGQLKREWLGRMRSSRELELMRGIKRVFDPEHILNPGRAY